MLLSEIEGKDIRDVLNQLNEHYSEESRKTAVILSGADRGQIENILDMLEDSNPDLEFYFRDIRFMIDESKPFEYSPAPCPEHQGSTCAAQGHES